MCSAIIFASSVQIHYSVKLKQDYGSYIRCDQNTFSKTTVNNNTSEYKFCFGGSCVAFINRLCFLSNKNVALLQSYPSTADSAFHVIIHLSDQCWHVHPPLWKGIYILRCREDKMQFKDSKKYFVMTENNIKTNVKHFRVNTKTFCIYIFLDRLNLFELMQFKGLAFGYGTYNKHAFPQHDSSFPRNILCTTR